MVASYTNTAKTGGHAGVSISVERDDFLLLETGDNLLLEDGCRILIGDIAYTPATVSNTVKS